MANGNKPLLKETLQLIIELQFFCRCFPTLASIHTKLFSKLSINIEVDSLEKSYNFSRYINNLQISLKEEIPGVVLEDN